jgi:hypothetical protein
MKEPRNVNIDSQNRATIRISARERDDLKLKKGDKYRTKVDKKRRRLIICFEQEEK